MKVVAYLTENGLTAAVAHEDALTHLLTDTRDDLMLDREGTIYIPTKNARLRHAICDVGPSATHTSQLMADPNGVEWRIGEPLDKLPELKRGNILSVLFEFLRAAAINKSAHRPDTIQICTSMSYPDFPARGAIDLAAGRAFFDKSIFSMRSHHITAVANDRRIDDVIVLEANEIFTKTKGVEFSTHRKAGLNALIAKICDVCTNGRWVQQGPKFIEPLDSTLAPAEKEKRIMLEKVRLGRLALQHLDESAQPSMRTSFVLGREFVAQSLQVILSREIIRRMAVEWAADMLKGKAEANATLVVMDTRLQGAIGAGIHDFFSAKPASTTDVVDIAAYVGRLARFKTVEVDLVKAKLVKERSTWEADLFSPRVQRKHEINSRSTLSPGKS